MAALPDKLRWFHPTPDRFVVALLVVEEILWLSEQFQWFAFNAHKGWGVLIEVAVAGAALVLMLLWCIAGRLFRWRFSFTIRTLLILALALALPFSCMTMERKKAKKQSEVAKEFEERGCLVGYDYQRDSFGTTLLNAQPPGPLWLRKLLGDDFFTYVVSMRYGGAETSEGPIATGLADDGLQHVNTLIRLQSLGLADSSVTDEGLRHLKGLDYLRWLDLSGTQVTDAGIAYIKRLPKLEGVDFSRTRITDSGVKKLKVDLPNCDVVR